MKKMLLLLCFMMAFIFVKAQSQYFCKSTVQTSTDSWTYKVWKDPSWSASGAIQINITQYYTNGTVTSTGWQRFVNGQDAGFTGSATYAVIEIRIVSLLGTVQYQFQVTNNC